jgi:hypothetical protein
VWAMSEYMRTLLSEECDPYSCWLSCWLGRLVSRLKLLIHILPEYSAAMHNSGIAIRDRD